MCNLANCDGTRLGHDLALDFPDETERLVQSLARLGGNREDRVMPENLRVDKPPLGLIPRFIRDEQRLEEIDEAIARYMAADPPWPIPQEWMQERVEIKYSLHQREHEKACCRECGTHANPHVGCILR